MSRPPLGEDVRSYAIRAPMRTIARWHELAKASGMTTAAWVRAHLEAAGVIPRTQAITITVASSDK